MSASDFSEIAADDVFNPKDFESIRLEIQFKNNTTHTEIKDTADIKLQEIGEKILVLEVPEKTCNIKHNIQLEIARLEKGQKPTRIFGATGKITELEDVGDGFLRITVECIQFEEKEWSDLQHLYSDRQAEIENFFKAVRGY